LCAQVCPCPPDRLTARPADRQSKLESKEQTSCAPQQNNNQPSYREGIIWADRAHQSLLSDPKISRIHQGFAKLFSSGVLSISKETAWPYAQYHMYGLVAWHGLSLGRTE